MVEGLPEGVTLCDSFPFDSSPNLVYTDQGYPRGDRSVDAWTMQWVFKQFFTNGVFGTPANALQIGKADSGFAVTIQPGMFIINGAMGGVKDSPITLTLDTQAAQGNTCYGIMLRYDNNSNMRSLGFRVVKNQGTYDPPAPDTTSENVYELRLGYVTVPNGNKAPENITNEKGQSVCPYAAPFDEIDVDGIVSDFRVRLQEAVNNYDANAKEITNNLIKNLEKYKDLIDAALDETVAGYLQTQIDELKNKSIDLANMVDNVTIGFDHETTGTLEDVLHVKNSGIGTDQIINGSVTSDKIADNSIHLSALSKDVFDVKGGFASADALFTTIADFMKAIYNLHKQSIDSLDLDTVINWDFNQDSQLISGVWENSSKYYYADGGVA